MVELNKPHKITGEKCRTYIFDNSELYVFNVIELIVSDSGTHRLKTKLDNEIRLVIIPPIWLGIEIESTKGWEA